MFVGDSNQEVKSRMKQPKTATRQLIAYYGAPGLQSLTGLEYTKPEYKAHSYMGLQNCGR